MRTSAPTWPAYAPMDVNEDGAADLVQIGLREIEHLVQPRGRTLLGALCRRRDTRRSRGARAAYASPTSTAARPDIVFADAGRFRWIDPMGGQKPRLLTSVDNGLGALTTLSLLIERRRTICATLPTRASAIRTISTASPGSASLSCRESRRGRCDSLRTRDDGRVRPSQLWQPGRQQRRAQRRHQRSAGRSWRRRDGHPDRVPLSRRLLRGASNRSFAASARRTRSSSATRTRPPRFRARTSIRGAGRTTWQHVDSPTIRTRR